ncbi:SDR family oxidoreductase [Microbacteriaceae bacterium VKM Ac-2854]|nr:SDR family oxidoreductase [Microbacteriaceae bacterium VKM Ac-2854]
MTRVAIIGAHGKVGQQILHLLYDAGIESVGIVRNPDHSEDIYRLGGEPVLLDVEHSTASELAEALAGCDAIVFTAGAGPGSSAERKRTVDYGASVLAQEAATIAGIRRFVQVSAINVDAPLADDTEPIWRAYVEAKRDADADLRDTELDWTILRPGTLTSDEATGRISLGDTVAGGSIPREDVAAVVVAVLPDPRSFGRTWEFVGGETDIAEAISAAV